MLGGPYPHIALVPALDDYDGLVSDFPSEDRFGARIRMHGDLTHGDPEYDRLVAESPSYARLHNWVYSPDFIGVFLEFFDDEIDRRVRTRELLFDPRRLPLRAEPFEGRKMIRQGEEWKRDPFLFPRLDLGIGRFDYGRVNGGGGVHVDNLPRIVSILVYIDHNPTMVGGEHRLYRLEGVTPVIEKVYPPRPNLMVASLQTNLALHDVNPITAITGVRKAMYMAVSCSTEIWRPQRDPRLGRLTKNRYRPGPVTRLTDRAARLVRRTIEA